MRDKVVKFNKNAYFVLPLVGLNTRSYGEDAFINSYITLDRVIILKLLVPEYTEPIEKKNLVSAWVNDGYSMVAYAIPEKFHKDFDAFIEGKYSHYSEEAFAAISDSISTEIIEINSEEISREVIKSYITKMHESNHPVSYNLVSDNIFTLTPIYLGSVAPLNHPARESLRISIGYDLDMTLPEDAELYNKPNLEEELLTPNMLVNENKSNQQK